MIKRWKFEDHILKLDVLKDRWSRIIDFVPLALDATPGYVFLVLSSDNDYNEYRYSLHFVGLDNLLITHPYERIFIASKPPDPSTKIYYFAFPFPQVLISINQYHYNEQIVLCPFLHNSCLDCVTTRISANTSKSCTWSPEVQDKNGICSIPSVIDSIPQSTM